MNKEQSDESEYEECTEERHKAVNLHAVKVLEPLMKELEEKYGDEQYETEFLGDLYARLIVSVYMGFRPQMMAKDAEAGALRLIKMSVDADFEGDEE
jgi:hypothetical protein